MKLKVTYMSGAGNLFTVIDNRELGLTISDGERLAPKLCLTKEFKTEGLMFLNKSKKGYSFECEFFNPDGSTGMMCGNGGRAITRFAQMNGIEIKYDSKFLMAGDIYLVSLNKSNIRLTLPAPKVLPKEFNLFVDSLDYGINTHYSNTGTHHLMIKYDKYWDEDFRSFDINDLAKPFRYHKQFQPDGVNVNFYKVIKDKVHLRTFEKGVEFETGACGTGAVATAITVSELQELKYPIKLIPPSEEELIVDVNEENGRIINIILEGPAKKIGEDQIEV